MVKALTYPMGGDHNLHPKVEKVLSRFENVTPCSDGWMVKCNSHDDDKNSLHISVQNGKILLHCFAGCHTEEILRKAGLAMSDLYLEEVSKRIVATYNYTDAPGNLLFQVVRQEPKAFRQRRPDGKGGWIYNLKDVTIVPYNLSALTWAIQQGHYVYIVEGEKDVHTLWDSFGLVGTTSPMGANNWRDEFNVIFKGAHVVLLPDNDNPGRAYVERIATALHGTAASIRILNLPGLQEKEDLTDWVQQGHTREDGLAPVSRTLG